MATVKSLEERLDDFAEEFGEVKSQLAATVTELSAVVRNQATTQAQLATLTSQLATVVNNQGATQAQFAVVLVKFDALVDSLKAMNTRIDGVTGKLEAMTTDYTAFKAKADTTFAITRRVGAFVAGVFFSVLVGGFTVVRSAGSLEMSVQQHQTSLDEVNKQLAEIRAKQK